jgi:hypothetical protein
MLWGQKEQDSLLSTVRWQRNIPRFRNVVISRTWNCMQHPIHQSKQCLKTSPQTFKHSIIRTFETYLKIGPTYTLAVNFCIICKTSLLRWNIMKLLVDTIRDFLDIAKILLSYLKFLWYLYYVVMNIQRLLRVFYRLCNRLRECSTVFNIRTYPKRFTNRMSEMNSNIAFATFVEINWRHNVFP